MRNVLGNRRPKCGRTLPKTGARNKSLQNKKAATMSENVNAGAQGQQPPPTEPKQMKPFRRLCRNFVDDFKKQQEKRSNLRRANLMGDLDSEEEKVAEEPDLPEYKFPGCKKDTANKAGSDCTCQQDFMRKYMIENLMTLETVCGGIDKPGCNAACKRANESQDCLEFFLMITKLEAMLDALDVEVNVKKKENSNNLEGTIHPTRHRGWICGPAILRARTRPSRYSPGTRCLPHIHRK